MHQTSRQLSYSEAKSLVERELTQMDFAPSSVDVNIVDDATVEKNWGWVFFYQSKKFLETGDASLALAGNAPFIVNRQTGDIVATGTAWPVEKYIEDYETQLLSDA
ncbi:MAG: YrhB domain-containing protein [Pseudomonadota bacterium]